METRVQLRQRLLRISEPSTTVTPNQHLLRRSSGLYEVNSDNNAGEDDQDVEDAEDGDEDDSDDDDQSEPEDASTSAAAPNEKHGQIKLLFSRNNPLRNPTVCFEYPTFLDIARAYPSNSENNTSAVGAVISVSAQDVPLYFKTHWERNCVKNAFASAGFVRTKKKWAGWHLAWAKHIPKDHFRLFKGGGDDCSGMQLYNHFPDPWVIGRKDRLLKTLSIYRRRFGAENYGFFPEGFNLPSELDAFLRAVQRDRSTPSSSDQSNAAASTWILKPPASSCGRGIRVVAAKDIAKLGAEFKRESVKLQKKKKAAKSARQYVIQRYLGDPLLMGGFKFDLRLYVLVTSLDPLRIYLFQEGITRFCTAKYSLQNTSNRFGHLTNYSINKKNTEFVENENALQENVGSKWSLTALFEHLVEQRLLEDPESLRSQIRDIICKTIVAAEGHLTPLMYQFVKKPTVCFELFGFDLMLDADLKPWLIEANVSPSLMGGSPLDKRVKGLLLSDIFHLVGLQVPVSNIPPNCFPSNLVDAAISASRGKNNAATSSNSSLRRATNSDDGRRQGVEGTRSRRSSGTPNGIGGASGTRVSGNKALHELALNPAIDCFDTHHLELFSPNDWDILDQMDDEMDRIGHFERIFPNAAHPNETARHASFFTCQRYANALCAKWLQTPAAVRARRTMFTGVAPASATRNESRSSSRS